MNRRLRFAAALIALFALFFSQMAVSAYACESDCPDMANANLCDMHCDYGASSVDHHSPSVGAPVLLALPWRIAPASVSFSGTQREWRDERHAGWPPPTRLAVLRI